MKYLFLLVLASVIFSSAVTIRHKDKDRLPYPYLAGFAVAILTALADIAGAMRSTPFRGAFLLMGIASAAEFLLMRKKAENPKVVRRISKAALIAMILEVTLFQLPSLPTVFLSKYKTVSLPLAAAEITGDGYSGLNEYGFVKINGDTTVIFDYKDINIPVGSIHADIEFEGNIKTMDNWIDMRDETVRNMRDNAAWHKIVRGVGSSSYVPCSFSGKVSELLIEFRCNGPDGSAVVRGITLNSPIPFKVSLIRYFIITGLAALTILIAGSAAMKRAVSNRKSSFRLWITEVTIVAMTLAILIAMVKAPDGGIKGFFMSDGGDQMTMQLVDAFENGRLYIDSEVPQELLELENPYFSDGREGIIYEWDHLLYKGKYYSYYGIAPVILLFMPFHMITGSYMTQNAAVLIFTLIGLIFLSMTYHTVIRRFFSHIPFGCAIAGHLVMMISCGIWFNVCQPQFYQSAISSGFAAITAGAYFIISSGIFGGGKLSLPRTALSSLFFGIAAMSRPTLAVYAISAYIIYAMNIKNADFISAEKTDKKRRIKYALCGGLPLAALGICQMAYNYARFGSPLDFGIQYSLTINDFTHSEFHLNFMLLGLFYYLIVPPMFRSYYPFITNDFSQFGINGYYYRCPETAAGLLFMAIPTVGYFLTGKALRKLPDRKTRLTVLAAAGIPFVLMPFIIICSIWESGYAVRYMADFSWEILMGALFVLFFLYGKCHDNTIKRLFRWFMGASVIAAVVIDVPIIFGVMFPRDEFPAISEKFSNIVAFWQ